MDLSETIRAMVPELTEWRHALHSWPETAFQEHKTAAFIARELRALGLEVHEGIAGTGVVGILRNGEGWSVGLRADIDALDVTETTDLPYASQVPGKMHACGHDGHTTMLLGAARALVANPLGPGTIVFIFQPAEENEGGARVMLEDGLFARFPVDQVYSLHNWPGLAAGRIAVHTGPVMAAFDTFELRVIGRGSHGAMPHEGIDPMTIAAQIQLGWQTLVSRAVAPVDPAVISITQMFGGDTLNAIPAQVTLRGTVRTFRPETRDFLETEMAFRASGIAAAYRADAELDYTRRYPATINADTPAEIARAAAVATVGPEAVDTDLPPSMAAEDFAFMMGAVPGAYVWVGNGPIDGGRNLHSPHYQFNDDILPVGVRYLCEVAARALAQGNDGP
jgi:hippurate hydrolase